MSDPIQSEPQVELSALKTPEVPETQEKTIETPDALNEFTGEISLRIEEATTQALESGSYQLESAATSIGIGPEDAEKGKDAIYDVQKAIQELSSETRRKLSEVSQTEQPGSEKEGNDIGLKDNYDFEQLARLRTKTKDDYGEGLVNKYHKGAKTPEEHEEAQKEAYKALEGKIESGAVKPDSIQSDILDRLELRNAPEIGIGSIDQISEQISSELKELIEKGFIKEDESALIKAEAENFTKIYAEAFPESDPQQIFEVARDNTRKLAYQTERDKQVFSGSDHGTRHILEGNMTMADRMIESLGDRISAKDKALIHQIIIDHDLGYTVGVAQAKESFDASKDHPLFSAKFIEANQEYYEKAFGKDGYEMIQNGILQHSYPKSEYGTATYPEKGFNPDI
ncbi:MAG: hypothetical protein WA063_02740, partial [Minisyncoccia bacterium]